jgi:hypothetical protein
MNIPSNVKKFVIIAGLGLLAAASAQARPGTVVGSTNPCLADQAKKFCGYQAGVTSLPSAVAAASNIWSKSLTQCAGQQNQQYVTYLNNEIGACSKSYSQGNSSCIALFADIAQPCSSAIDTKIANNQAAQLAACASKPWCGYQAGVSAAKDMPKLNSGTMQPIGSIMSVSQNNCVTYYNNYTRVPAAVTNWFTNMNKSCYLNSTATAFDPSCATILDSIGNTCAPAGLPQQ